MIQQLPPSPPLGPYPNVPPEKKVWQPQALDTTTPLMLGISTVRRVQQCHHQYKDLHTIRLKTNEKVPQYILSALELLHTST